MKAGCLRSVVAGIAFGLVTAAAGAAAAQGWSSGPCKAGDAVCEADALSPQVEELYRAGKLDAAAAAAEKVLALREKALGPNHAGVGEALENLGVVYAAKSAHDRAEPLFLRALAIHEKALGPDHLRVALSLNRLAGLYLQRGSYGRVEALLRRALAIREKALAPDHPDVGVSLNNLAELLRKQGAYDRAEPLFQRALAIVEKALGPDHPDVATALINLALTVQAKGANDRAEPLFQRALAIREKALGPDHPAVGVALNNLALVTYAKGAFGRAEPRFQRALAILEKTLGPDHPEVATTLGNLALTAVALGAYDRADPLFQRALAIREKALGPNHRDVGAALNNLALLAQAKGAYEQAEPLYQRALATLEKALGPDHPEVATTLDNLARLSQARGAYDRAEPFCQRALAIRERALGPDHPDVAATLDSLAVLSQMKGAYDRAEPLQQRALAIREKALGPDHPAVGIALNNLAELLRRQGKLDRAEPVYERALAVLEKALGPDHREVATTLSNLALLFQMKGAYDRAEPLHRRALAAREKVLGPDHPDVGASLNNLAELAWEMGASERAESFYQRALAIEEKALGPDHPDLATTLANLVVLRWAKGDLPRALALMTRSAEIRERNLTRFLASGSEPQRRAYAQTLVQETSMVPSLARQGGPPAVRFALTTWLRRKGRVLDAMADTYASLRRRLDPGDQKTFERLVAVRSQLGAIVFRSPDPATAAQRRAYVESLQREADELETKLSRRSAVFRAEDRPVTIADVQATLPEGAALVELQRHKPYDPKPGVKPDDRWGAVRYAAYVLRRTGDPSLVDLGDAAAVDTAVRRLRSALDDAGHDLAAVRAAARAVDALVMAPLRPHLSGLHHVLLSPDGELNLLPFAALLDERGHYLVEQTTFTYLTSGRDLLRNAHHSPAREGPLVLGHPDYGPWAGATLALADGARGQRSRDLQGRMPFKPLEGTLAEARAVAAQLPGARLLVDGAATEGAIKAARAPSVLHLATHGFFFADQAADRRAVENALLRSGLVFAGANTLHSGDDDGVLTALEAGGLDLDGTKLVVLSACETGEGTASAGEGVYGLRRALGMAGAETVVMSLWDADDDATRALMTAYYRRLEKGSGRSEALREAQLELLASPTTAPPHMWAAFIVSGNDAPLDTRRDLGVPAAAPGVRGCACSLGGEEPARSGSWAALGMLWLAGLARGRRKAAAHPP